MRIRERSETNARTKGNENRLIQFDRKYILGLVSRVSQDFKGKRKLAIIPRDRNCVLNTFERLITDT